MAPEKTKKPKKQKASDEDGLQPKPEADVEDAAPEDVAEGQGKKKRKKPTEGQVEEAVAAGAESKQKKAKKNGAEAQSNADEATTPAAATVDEEKRRQVQREIQQLVVRLRKEGKSEQEIKAAKWELKNKYGSLSKPDGSRAKKSAAWRQWMETDDAKQQTKENSLKKHELVVIPVVWRGRHDKMDVFGAAEDIKACVAQQGVDVWVDARRHYKPGQKFAHWEHRGVMLRVEVGPEDIRAGICRVCKAKTPGDFQSVERKRVRLPPIGARSLLLALKEFGLSKIDIERRDGDSADEAEAANATPEAPAGAAAKVATPQEEEEVQGNWAPAAKADKEKRPKKKRGTKKRRRRKILRE